MLLPPPPLLAHRLETVSNMHAQFPPISRARTTPVGSQSCREQASEHAGGEKKRRQVGIPGLFKTAEEAAQLLALIKKIGPKTLWPEEGLPPKLDKQHKQRSHAAACTAAMRAPLVDVPMPPIVAFATPIPFPAMNAPLVAASPLPMMPFGSVAL